MPWLRPAARAALADDLAELEREAPLSFQTSLRLIPRRRAQVLGARTVGTSPAFTVSTSPARFSMRPSSMRSPAGWDSAKVIGRQCCARCSRICSPTACSAGPAKRRSMRRSGAAHTSLRRGLERWRRRRGARRLRGAAKRVGLRGETADHGSPAPASVAERSPSMTDRLT